VGSCPKASLRFPIPGPEAGTFLFTAEHAEIAERHAEIHWLFSAELSAILAPFAVRSTALVIVFQADDVVLAEVCAALHFEENQRGITLVGDAVGLSPGHVNRLS